MAATRRVCASVNIATTAAGINMDAVRFMGEVVTETAQRTSDEAAIGCAKLVVFANAVPENPFMAGAFLGLVRVMRRSRWASSARASWPMR